MLCARACLLATSTTMVEIGRLMSNNFLLEMEAEAIIDADSLSPEANL